MQQVFHTWIWGSSAIPPCRSSPVLSGWMVNVGGQPFLGLSRDAQLGLSQGSGWAIQEQSRSCCEATPSLFSCVLRVIVLLEGKPSAQSEVLSTLEKVFVQDIPVLGRIHLSLDCNQSSCPCSWKHPHSMMLPPPCFTVGTVLDRWWAVPGFLHTYRLELRPKSSILVSSDQRILQVFFSKLHAGFSCVGPLCHKAPTGGGLQWWLTFYNFLPSPECISGAQPQWSLGSSLPLSPRLFSPDSSVWPDGQL